MWLCVMEKSRTKKEKRNHYGHIKKKIHCKRLKECETMKRPKTVGYSEPWTNTAFWPSNCRYQSLLCKLVHLHHFLVISYSSGKSKCVPDDFQYSPYHDSFYLWPLTWMIFFFFLSYLFLRFTFFLIFIHFVSFHKTEVLSTHSLI